MRNGIILVPFGPLFNVSTLTPLFSALAIARLRRVLITLENPDVTNPVTLYVDPGTSGSTYNAKRRQSDVADPGGEAHVEIADPCQYPFVRGYAQTDDPFPTVVGVTFEVRGEAESPGQLEWLLRSVAGSTPG